MGSYNVLQMSNLLKNADIVMIVYAAEKHSSFQSVQDQLDLIESNSKEDVIKVLVGHKHDAIDFEPQTRYTEEEDGLMCFYTSIQRKSSFDFMFF